VDLAAAKAIFQKMSPFAVEVLVPSVVEDAQHRCSSYVIETAILHAGTTAQHAFAARILGGGVQHVELSKYDGLASG